MEENIEIRCSTIALTQDLYQSCFTPEMRKPRRPLIRLEQMGRYEVWSLPSKGENGVNAGFVYCFKINDRIKHIDYLGVNEKFRGKGTGSALMRKLIDINQLFTLTLECEGTLVNFYGRFGFQVIPKPYDYQGHSMHLMIRAPGGLRCRFAQIYQNIWNINHVLQILQSQIHTTDIPVTTPLKITQCDFSTDMRYLKPPGFTTDQNYLGRMLLDVAGCC